MKKKIRLKKWVKVVITLIIIVVGIILYRYLSFKGAYAGENNQTNIIILLGWFLLIIGEIMSIYFMWEE